MASFSKRVSPALSPKCKHIFLCNLRIRNLFNSSLDFTEIMFFYIQLLFSCPKIFYFIFDLRLLLWHRSNYRISVLKEAIVDNEFDILKRTVQNRDCNTLPKSTLVYEQRHKKYLLHLVMALLRVAFETTRKHSSSPTYPCLVNPNIFVC